jgi:hypothetical protein
VWVDSHTAVYASGVEASAHEVLKVRLCKRDGCDLEADKPTGPYAMLCRHHAEQAGRARRANGARAAPAVEANGAGPHEQATRRLILLARHMDETKRAYDEASSAWREAITQLPTLAD